MNDAEDPILLFIEKLASVANKTIPKIQNGLVNHDLLMSPTKRSKNATRPIADVIKILHQQICQSLE